MSKSSFCVCFAKEDLCCACLRGRAVGLGIRNPADVAFSLVRVGKGQRLKVWWRVSTPAVNSLGIAESNGGSGSRA